MAAALTMSTTPMSTVAMAKGVASLASFAYIVTVALTKDPRGFMAWL